MPLNVGAAHLAIKEQASANASDHTLRPYIKGYLTV
jgi:hypothetical protein